MTTRIFDRIFRRRRSPDEGVRRNEIVRKAMVIEAAEQGEFYRLLMDEAAALHAHYLTQSKDSNWYAGAAFALLDLTKCLETYKSARDRILADDKLSADRHQQRQKTVNAERYEPTHGDPQAVN